MARFRRRRRTPFFPCPAGTRCGIKTPGTPTRHLADGRKCDILKLDSTPLHTTRPPQAGKQRLAAQIVASELGIDEAAVTKRLEELKILLPDLASRIGTMKTADLCRLAMRVPDVAAALVRTSCFTISPTATEASQQAAGPPAVLAKCARRSARLTEDPLLAPPQVRLRNVFPSANVAKMCAIEPGLLQQDPKARH